MKKLHVLAIAVVAALGSTFAVAQTAPAGMKAAPRIDVNGDGVIDRAEAAKAPRLAAKFDQLDTNKDGKLSASERPQRAHGKHRGAGPMQALDTDKDGRISKAEAQAGKPGFAGKFAEMDVNKDGYLDRSDRELRMTRERAAFFAGADANKDGKLSRDEFVVEQGARGEERRAQFAKRMEAAGKTQKARPAPTQAEQIERAGSAFDRMDANKDGTVTKAEFDAAKSLRGGDRPHPRKH